MIPLRVQVKYFVENPQAVELTPFIGIFQRWIQQHSINELLIDVADYGHVPNGPGIILIGHESDFGMDMSEGRPGLLYTRKRQLEADLQQQLRASFRLALSAARLIENEPYFKGKIKFHTDEAEIRIPDRLQYPNKPETFDAVRDDIAAVLVDVYGSTATNIVRVENDPRQSFTIALHAAGAPDVSALLENLQLTVAK